MKILFIVLFSYFFASSAFSQSQGIHKKDCQTKGDVCGSCEKEKVEWLMGNDLGPESDDPKNEDNRKDFKNGLLSVLSDPTGNADKEVDNGSGKKIKVKDLKSVEDFIEFLPKDMKSDVAYFGESRSLQEGDRYLLKSANSEIVMSFNSHPDKDPLRANESVKDLRGGNAVEMLVWNGAKAVWELVELKFRNGKPQVTRNPDRCLSCHGRGASTRPNMDPYNFWSQTKPFFRDELQPNTKEATDYLDFVKRIKRESDDFKSGGPKTRYSILRHMLDTPPLDDIAQMEKELTDGNSVKLSLSQTKYSFAKEDGAAVQIFDQMYLSNHCKNENTMTNKKYNPHIDTMKYAISGATQGCFSSMKMEDFFPPEVIKKNQEHHNGAGLGSGSYKDVKKDTDTRQKDYFDDRIGRKLWIIEKGILEKKKSDPVIKAKLEAADADTNVATQKILIKLEEEAYIEAKKEFQTLVPTSGLGQVTDKEQSLDNVAPLRFMLEPMGIDTSMFSTSVDPGSYTFGDNFRNINRYGLLKEIKEETRDCKVLAEKSLAAYRDSLNSDNSVLDAKGVSCKPYRSGALVPGWVKKTEAKLLNDNRKRLLPKVKKALMVCSMCHRRSRNFAGAPVIPFNDANAFDNMLAKQAGEIGNMQEIIWRRLRRHADIKGAMPLDMGGAQLTDKELATVKEYLESFPQRDYIKKINTGSGRNAISRDSF